MGQVKEKILLLGSKGMAGHIILMYLRDQGFVVHDVARDDRYFKPKWRMDVCDFPSLEKLIDENHYTTIINCVGILNNDANDNVDQAILVNSYLPHFLAKKISSKQGRLIHISTDCVFSGEKGSYNESDRKDGSTTYAQTKSLGEVIYGKHLTIRTSIVGPELNSNGIGLLGWFLRQRGIIKGYIHAYWSGVTTLELAKAIGWFLAHQEIQGLVHLTNNQKVSKYELLLLFQKHIANAEISAIEPFAEYFTDKSLVNTRRDVTYPVAGYESMLRELTDWMKHHTSIYKGSLNESYFYP